MSGRTSSMSAPTDTLVTATSRRSTPAEQTRKASSSVSAAASSSPDTRPAMEGKAAAPFTSCTVSGSQPYSSARYKGSYPTQGCIPARRRSPRPQPGRLPARPAASESWRKWRRCMKNSGLHDVSYVNTDFPQSPTDKGHQIQPESCSSSLAERQEYAHQYRRQKRQQETRGNSHRNTGQATAAADNRQSEVHRGGTTVADGHSRATGDHQRDQGQGNDFPQHVIQEGHATPCRAQGIANDNAGQRIPAKAGRQRQGLVPGHLQHRSQGQSRQQGAECQRQGNAQSLPVRQQLAQRQAGVAQLQADQKQQHHQGTGGHIIH